MRQISASKRSQNVVEIANTDYCGFWHCFSFYFTIFVNILLQKNPADHHDQQGARPFPSILTQHRTNDPFRTKKEIPTIKNDRNNSPNCPHMRTDSSCQAGPVSQNQIRKRE